MPADLSTPGGNFKFSIPRIPDIENITAVSDPVLRNLQITQSYWELSGGFAERTGRSPNWCTFATWASRQAGQSIRGEDLKRAMEVVLQKEPVIGGALDLIVTVCRRLGSVLTHYQIKQVMIAAIVKHITDRAGDAVARGNTKVFREIGHEFARFLSTCFADSIYSEENILQFCSLLIPGDPPGGQEYLKRAFKSYYESFFVTDKTKADELRLLANIEIGFHEQTRLQPEIAESLNAVMFDVEEVKDHLKKALFADRGKWDILLSGLRDVFGPRSLLDKAVNQLLYHAEHHMRRIITEHLMSLTIPPDKCLRLGRDLEAPFPGELQKLSNPDLLAMFAIIDPTPDSLSETGATDWADLKERLHFIADLFRCYHNEACLFGEAFSADQVTDLKNGKVPGGRL